MRIAVMIFDAATPSPYGRLLAEWTESRTDCTLFDDRKDGDGRHYLQFDAFQRDAPFDVVLYDVADTAAHAAAFPYIAGHAGILFCNDIRLWNFARAVSHEPRDGWGTWWIFSVAAPDDADLLSELAERDLDPGKLLDSLPLAHALAVRSAGVATPDWEWARVLSAREHVPPVGCIDPESSAEEFNAVLEKYLPRWREWSAHMNSVLDPVEHPHRDLFAVERVRIIERYGAEHAELAQAAITALRGLFDGATNSVTREEEERT